MLHQTSFGILLFGIINFTICGSTGSLKCPNLSSGNTIQYKCPSIHHVESQVCQISCAQGYKLTGSPATISCHSGRWSHTSARCEAIVCPVPTVNNRQSQLYCQINGRHITHGYKIGSVCTVHCPKDFAAVHPRFVCIGDSHGGAKWSAQPSCKATKCPPPPHPPYGAYQCPSRTYGISTMCTLTCDSGYRPKSTPSSITCQSSATWSTPSCCVPIACPVPPKIANGAYTCSSAPHTLNGVCQLHCDPGYRPSATHSDIKCLSTSKWSAPASCSEIRCPVPPKVTHGVYSCETSTPKLNDVCHLQCIRGFQPSTAKSDITCLSSGDWSLLTSCVAFACPVHPKIANGAYICTSGSHKLNDVCHLHCNHGYRPSTTHSDIKCLSSSRWSTPASCSEIKCPAPPIVTNGKYACASSPTHKLNDVCHLQCSTGYKPSNTASDIRCLDSAKWSSSSSCEEIKCPTPPTVNHGTYICVSSTTPRLNDVCHLLCSTGYKPTTVNSDIKCLYSEKWSASTACEEIRCPTPPAVSYGSFHCSPNIHSPGSTCSLTCDTGYTPSGSDTTIVCSSLYTWSSSPKCEEIRCPTTPVVSHGRFHCSSTVHKPGSTCSLSCDTGYSPSRSNTEIVCSSSSTWSSSPTCKDVPTTTITTRTTNTMPTTSETTINVSSPKNTTTTSETTSGTTTPLTTKTTVSTTTTTSSPANRNTTSTTTRATAVPTTIAPLGCEVCSGSLCGLIPGNDPVIKCPDKTPYCLNHVDNDSTGSKTVTKSCASEDECNRRWWHETSDKSNCVDFNPTNIYNYQLSCTYCCTKPGCNKDIVPARHTLFIGHD